MPNNLKIINNEEELKIEWTCKVHEHKKKYTRKDGTIAISKFYKATFPTELIETIHIKDKTIYFYEKNGRIYISAEPPQTTKYKQIKLQSYNHFSIPRDYITVTKEDIILLTLNLLDLNPITKTRGVLTINKQ